MKLWAKAGPQGNGGLNVKNAMEGLTMVSKEMESRIDKFIADNRQNIVNDIAALVNIKSVSQACDNPQAPYGEGCRKVLDKALQMCDQMGFATKNYDYYAGSAAYGSGEKEIALLGHLDVVPEGDGWSHDPYDMIEKDGYIYGRGVADDKGPTVLGLYAMKCMKELGVQPNYTFRLVMGCSEETGMSDMPHYLAAEKAPTFAFTPDADFPVCIGEKGQLSVAIELAVDGKTITGFTGGTVGNAVCASATVTLQGVSEADLGDYDHSVYHVESVEGGIKLTATGKTAHAAKPEGSINATKLLCEKIAALPQLSDAEKKAMAVVAEVLKDCHGAGIGVPVEDEVSGKITHINGVDSMKDKVITLKLDIRYPVTFKGDELFPKIEAHVAQAGGKAILNHNTSPCYKPADTQEIKTLLAAYDHVTGEKGVPYTIGGGTYAKHFDNAVAFGPHFRGMPNPCGEGKGEEHMPDECNSVDYMMKALKIYVISLIGLNELSL